MKLKMKLSEVVMMLIIVSLAVAANLPEDIIGRYVDPIVLVTTLITLVLISLLNHFFKLIPNESVSSRADSSQSRKAVLEAVKTGNLSKLKHLLQMKVEVNFVEDGVTPLHLAAVQGNTELTRALLEYGVNLNLQNKEGLTAMEAAVASGLNQTVELLNSFSKGDLKTT